MLGLADMSEEEKKLLREIAKAKGQSLEDTLAELGHGLKPIPEAEVVVQLTGAPPVVAEPSPAAPLPGPPPPPAAEEVKEAAEEGKEAVEAIRLSTIKQVCIQCGWDQDLPTILPPDHADKLGFLHAMLGQKVFSKKYKLFGGQLEFTFRALTVGEIDALYQEAYAAQQAQLFATTAEYYDYLNQNRMCLQLIGLSARQSALHIRLPEGLSKESNGNASAYWTDLFPPVASAVTAESQLDVQAQKREVSVALLTKVRTYIQKKVLITEQLHRVAVHTCAKFNRLMVKMEVNVDNENFWKGTEPQF